MTTAVIIVLGVALLAALGWGFNLRRARSRLAARLASGESTRAQLAAGLDTLTAELTRLRAVLDGMADGVWLTDGDGTVIAHNDALKEMLYAGQELTGKRPLDLVRNPSLHDAVQKALREGERSQLELGLEGVRPRTFAVTVSRLGQGREGSLAVFRDVTELRRLEKVRVEFVANVSHELRTPITAILGYAETLLAGGLDDRAHAPQMVEVIHRQSERLSHLVSDLLELSKLDAQELSLAIRPLALAPLAKRAAEAIAPRLAIRRLRFQLNVPDDLRASADERAIEQVLLNLLDNAVKFTPDGGEVALRGERAGERIRLVVRDSGVGIEPKHVPRLFERFYRVDRGRSREMGGTGLGLSIVKHLVAAMDGEVQVQSQPGVGSEFSVLLPSADRNPEASG